MLSKWLFSNPEGLNLDEPTRGIDVGKYRVSALVRPLDDGGYTSGVSIRSGRGSATTDRVMRFTEDFPTHEAAARYAMAQGIDWVRDSAGPAIRPN